MNIARWLALASAALAATWCGYLVATVGGIAFKGLLVALAGTVLVGAWPSRLRPGLVLGTGFGLLLTAVAFGYYIGLFVLPAVALAWAAGMAAGFAAPPPQTRNLRLAGWGLLIAAAAYFGSWTHFNRSGERIEQNSTSKTLQLSR